jgi:hypothetical protein
VDQYGLSSKKQHFFSNYPQKSRNFVKSIVQLAIQPTSTHQPTSNWEIEISI